MQVELVNFWGGRGERGSSLLSLSIFGLQRGKSTFSKVLM